MYFLFLFLWRNVSSAIKSSGHEIGRAQECVGKRPLFSIIDHAILDIEQMTEVAKTFW